MRGKIKFITVSAVERVAILLDSSGMPRWWPNLFATINYRNRGHSFNSIRNILGAIEMAYLWAGSIGKDLDQLLLGSKWFDRRDMLLLANFLGYTAREQNRIASYGISAANGSKVVSLEAVRPKSPQNSCNPIPSVSFREHATRIYYVAAFALFVIELQASKQPRNKIHNDSVYKRTERDLAFFKSLIPSISSHGDDEALEALTYAQVKAIEGSMHPDSGVNPFHQPFVRHRNYLLWRFFYDTGGRIGEIYNLKVADLRYRDRLVDLRVSKTRPRTVSVSHKTMELFNEFIQCHWSKLPRSARRGEWLWTSVKGDRLSINSISNVFVTIRDKVPECPDWLTSHTMRRTWNHRFSDLIDYRRSSGEVISADQEEMMRNRLNGWSENSQTGSVYNRRRIRQQADILSEQLNSIALDRQHSGGKWADDV